MSSRNVKKGPPLRSLDQINLNLVRQAQKLRARDEPIPLFPREVGIEYVAYLRTTGALVGNGFKDEKFETRDISPDGS